MKKLHSWVLRSFVGPFVGAFMVLVFILLMQLLTKYIDDIVGKGFELAVFGKLIFYGCLVSVPLALPLSLLFSALLTMGNLGERYELAALKSSGVSLLRIMYPLISFSVGMMLLCWVYTSYWVPVFNLKLYSLMYNMSKVNPTFVLKEGQFYSDLEDYEIYTSRIDRSRNVLYQLKIYNHTGLRDNKNMTTADSGRMEQTPGGRFLYVQLYNGEQYQENVSRKQGIGTVYEFQQVKFDSLNYRIPLSGFELEEEDTKGLNSHHYMKNIEELIQAKDSMQALIDTSAAQARKQAGYYIKLDSLSENAVFPKIDVEKKVIEWFPTAKREQIYNLAMAHARTINSLYSGRERWLEPRMQRKRAYMIEFHNRFMLPVACVIFMVLGASLGAVIRKGGLGVPMLVSVVFFILFYVLLTQGKKFARDEILPVWVGGWLPALVVLPLSVYFAYQSVTDSPLLQSGAWKKLFGKVSALFKPKKK